jgi:hypothetical protein
MRLAATLSIMTIAISIKINEGVVLASDSASTLVAPEPGGKLGVVNVYFSANKIFNLLKGHPVGVVTWGAGGIGQASISTLVKDLRRLLAGEDERTRKETKQPPNYRISVFAERLSEFIFRLYKDRYGSLSPESRPSLSFIIAGFSSGTEMAEEYQIDIAAGGLSGPRLIRAPDACGITFGGVQEAIYRLLFGFSPRIGDALAPWLREAVDLQQLREDLTKELGLPLVQPAMPLQDAIDLAEFLVDLSSKFSRFAPGPQLIGGPIEIAAITKHEEFKWIRRKHYYSTEFNVPE